MADKLSKGKVVNILCEQLGIEDYTQLEVGIARLLKIITEPLWGVTIMWKPGIPGSQQVAVLGVPTTSQAAQQISDVLSTIARQFTEQALQMAMMPPIPEEEVEENGGDNGEPPDQS